MIQVENLHKEFQVHRKAAGLKASLRSLFRRETVTKVAVDHVSFNVGEGEIVGLVGANGAGKTTIVKMLAGIIHPTSGHLRVLGHEPWARHNDFRRQIALIMGQKAQLWWDLPAADCFLLLREIYQVPKKEHGEMLDFLLDLLDVREELNIQIRRLSLGERMKMELIAALLHRPRVVFLDEPTIGLDLAAQRAIRDFILRYRQEMRPAMILTSHYMEDIERLCERIIIIRDGRFIFDGPLGEVVSRFAQHKIITASLSHGGRGLDWLEAAGGEVLSQTGSELRLRVARDEVADVAQRLLCDTGVHDLGVEEEDVAEVIEQMFAEKRGG
ncbi:MAG: ATP-binding cassette domain-containing protein [Thermodesulfobacteriota bacterium]